MVCELYPLHHAPWHMFVVLFPWENFEMDKNVRINAEKKTFINLLEKMSVGFLHRLVVPVMKRTDYAIFYTN